jgi:hypothetical protein
MTTTTTTNAAQRRATGDALNALCADLKQYASFTIGRVTIHADAGRGFQIEIVDRFGWIDDTRAAHAAGKPSPSWYDYVHTGRGETLDDAFIALAHKLTGTEEAPF